MLVLLGDGLKVLGEPLTSWAIFLKSVLVPVRAQELFVDNARKPPSVPPGIPTYTDAKKRRLCISSLGGSYALAINSWPCWTSTTTWVDGGLAKRPFRSLHQPEKLLRAGDGIGHCVLPISDDWSRKIGGPER